MKSIIMKIIIGMLEIVLIVFLHANELGTWLTIGVFFGVNISGTAIILGVITLIDMIISNKKDIPK